MHNARFFGLEVFEVTDLGFIFTELFIAADDFAVFAQALTDAGDGRNERRHIPNVVKQLLDCVRKVQARNYSHH